MRAVLDTSVVIAPDVSPLEGELAISAVTLAELHYGVLIARDERGRAERLRRLALVERSFDPLPVDATVARAFGRVAAAVVGHGRNPRPRAMDLLIAATALAHDARLYTRNAADLAGVEALLDVVAV